MKRKKKDYYLHHQFKELSEMQTWCDMSDHLKDDSSTQWSFLLLDFVISYGGFFAWSGVVSLKEVDYYEVELLWVKEDNHILEFRLVNGKVIFSTPIVALCGSKTRKTLPNKSILAINVLGWIFVFGLKRRWHPTIM